MEAILDLFYNLENILIEIFLRVQVEGFPMAEFRTTIQRPKINKRAGFITTHGNLRKLQA